MKPARDDLPHRRLAWAALSDLYLDTDTSLSRAWRVETLQQTPYSLDELETILVTEVHPVCRWNLHPIAGEWAGFEADWLEEKILRLRPAWPWLIQCRRWRVRRWAEWRTTQAALCANRAQGT